MEIPTDYKSIMTPTEYVGWLETKVVSLLKANEQLEREVYFLVKKNMQLEDQELATTIALIKNPLNSRKEFRV